MKVRWAMPLSIATAAVGLGLFAPTTGLASCARPGIEIVVTTAGPLARTRVTAPATTAVSVRRGAHIDVKGSPFFEGCDDVSGSTGCSGPSRPKLSQSKPKQQVALTITQGTRSWILGTVDADSKFETRWSVDLPVDLAPGSAVLKADLATLPVNVRR